MSKTTRYKAYTIVSTPFQRLPSTQWTLCIDIAWDRDGMAISQSFSTDVMYDAEEDADQHGLAYGQSIIDGKVPGQSLD